MGDKIISTPYVPHYFGEAAEQRLSASYGWLTAGVATSIAWPSADVWLTYNGDDFIIRGSKKNGNPSPPGITTPCINDSVNDSLSKIYRFTSVLSWFHRGYVEVSGYTVSSHPILYGDVRKVYSDLGLITDIHFNCNHLPIIEEENTRIALAFWREGMRLLRLHDNYAFLSFYKVIESQFNDGHGKKRKHWIEANIDHLTGRAAQRVKDLRDAAIDVSAHLFESGRCAVAHASLDGKIIDPDIPEDRRRISNDVELMQDLAKRYIAQELCVPNESILYETRDRLSPLHQLMPEKLLKEMQESKAPDGLEFFNDLNASICVWPDSPPPGFENMAIEIIEVADGVALLSMTNKTKSIYLEFTLDFPNGKAHTQLQNSGLRYRGTNVTEQDVVSFTTYFTHVLSNRIVEIRMLGIEPIDCEVVIPVNIIPMGLDEALKVNLQKHNKILAKKTYQLY
ncbi:MAG: hypothetical protein Q7U15_08870 [Methylotenera sp.]|jgi:hypothetical protein|nr:hypothetical protein [Methylotenera sp.]MDP1958961.1 hypothetical protein [Methylotenera sp.]MDP2404235.1 hypothetical protein [Methylotenera sp.]